MLIGCMIWRIGEVVDLYEQIAWLRSHAFEAVAFWTCAGELGVWQGLDAPNATSADVDRLRSALAPFACVDLHAAVPLCADAVPELLRTVALAGDLSAATVTIHVEQAEPAALSTLDEAAEAACVRIGLELTGGYGLALREATPRTGLTLDVGHVSFDEGAGYRDFGSIGGLIRHVGDRLVHVHAHDYNGVLDHLPVGAGHIDWDDIASALKATGYDGVVCLELNPDRATPEQLLDSRERLRELLG